MPATSQNQIRCNAPFHIPLCGSKEKDKLLLMLYRKVDGSQAQGGVEWLMQAHLRGPSCMLMEVEVNDVAHFLAAAIHPPVMPVKW